MKLSLSTSFFTLLLAVSLFSCTDHRLGGPASPARLRLQSLQSATPTGTAAYLYTYSYDSQNRPVSINRAVAGVNTLAIIAYGDPQQKYTYVSNDTRTLYLEYPNSADQRDGTITPYPSMPTGTSFATTKYGLLNSKIYTSNVVRNYNYTFNASQQLTEYSEVGSGTDVNTFKYTTTGDNITAEQYSYSAGRGDTGTVTYTYDDRPNPLFGLLDPTVSNTQRLSRNNVLTKTNASQKNFNSGLTTYAYEYNGQGLPTKRTATYNGSVIETLTYNYESY
ncbi:hypothetical protein [Spirosoma sp. KUDC1026]|uniref:hypothetical protein n=1 Tax=Spirosoma sp. KUDC1026 TaxID=2745947 RepID=UPI00159BDC8A|nr:hypothetical protein [Spirosoma sp. KUDC1026]QKZ13562.1 hypothetical protein HU175_13330 [Spirosoma sp. KUDC1026]